MLATNTETAILIHFFKHAAKTCIKLNEDFIGKPGGHLETKSDDPGLKQFCTAINHYVAVVHELIKFRKGEGYAGREVKLMFYADVCLLPHPHVTTPQAEAEYWICR